LSMDTAIRNLVVEVVHKIRPEGTVLEALQTMLEKDVGCLVVSGVGGPIGLVTEKDVLRKVTALRRDPGKVQVREVMSSPLISTSMDTTVGDAAKKMIEGKIKRLVVMGEDGSFLGLVTMTDIVRWVAERKELSDSLINYLMYDVP
jgi:CBS domain-containing protein